MLAFNTWMVNVMTGDATLQALMGQTSSNMAVYPMDVDIQPEVFPSITYTDISNVALSNPRGMHVGIIQLDIYSINDALETEQIYDRLEQLFNFKDSTTQNPGGTLWWIRENGARDVHTPTRRLWRKSIDLKYWFNTLTNY